MPPGAAGSRRALFLLLLLLTGFSWAGLHMYFSGASPSAGGVAVKRPNAHVHAEDEAGSSSRRAPAGPVAAARSAAPRSSPASAARAAPPPAPLLALELLQAGRRPADRPPAAARLARSCDPAVAVAAHPWHARSVGTGDDPQLPATYPLTDSYLAGTRDQSPGETSRWQGMLRKLVGGQPVHVLIFGGSETAGSGCAEPSADGGPAKQGKECAWPARFGAWLRGLAAAASADRAGEAAGGEAELVMGSVTVDNFARGGTNTHTILAALGSLLSPRAMAASGMPPAGPDLLVTDFCVNVRPGALSLNRAGAENDAAAASCLPTDAPCSVLF